MMISMLDATHTYRGYRQQALYVLWRILNDTGNLVFQPEGVEDLAVFDSDGMLVEVTQVKAYSTNLTLPAFDPSKTTSFFNRVHSYLQAQPELAVNIVSFGDFGSTLHKALMTDGSERKQVSEQISSYGNLTQIKAENVLAAIQPIQVSEQDMRDSIETQLRDSLIGEPDSSFESYPIGFTCAPSESRKSQDKMSSPKSIKLDNSSMREQRIIVSGSRPSFRLKTEPLTRNSKPS